MDNWKASSYPEYITYPGLYWEESPRAGQYWYSLHFNFITQSFSSVVRDDGKNVMNTMNNRLVACWFLTKTRLIALCYLTAIFRFASPTNKSGDWLKIKGIVLGDKFSTRDIHRLFQAKENIFAIISFRETMESDAMWQFIEQVSGFNIKVS